VRGRHFACRTVEGRMTGGRKAWLRHPTVSARLVCRTLACLCCWRCPGNGRRGERLGDAGRPVPGSSADSSHPSHNPGHHVKQVDCCSTVGPECLPPSLVRRSGQWEKEEEPARWAAGRFVPGLSVPRKLVLPSAGQGSFFVTAIGVLTCTSRPGQGQGRAWQAFSPIKCPSGITLPASDVGRTWSMEGDGGEAGISRRLSIRRPYVVRGQMGGHRVGILGR
jgi:hypothetical protein